MSSERSAEKGSRLASYGERPLLLPGYHSKSIFHGWATRGKRFHRMLMSSSFWLLYMCLIRPLRGNSVASILSWPCLHIIHVPRRQFECVHALGGTRECKAQFGAQFSPPACNYLRDCLVRSATSTSTPRRSFPRPSASKYICFTATPIRDSHPYPTRPHIMKGFQVKQHVHPSKITV